MSLALKEKKKGKYGLTFENLSITGYESVIKITSEGVGLTAIIAIHDTRLGPALGGTRMQPYPTFEAALNDALRLSAGMTYKSAISMVGWGGGKSVIIADPKAKNKEALLLAFGEAVKSLKGKYICAEDVGCGIEDTMTMNKENPYIVGLPHEKSSGNPSPYTAWGTFRGIQATLKKLYGSESLEGKTVAVQGLGSVGRELVEMLFWNGASLVVADIDPERSKEMAERFGAVRCSPLEIFGVECDIFSPCALGGILNDQTIPKLRCRGIAGAANNQLLRESHAIDLKKRGILYAPDFVVNAGGLLNVSCELDKEGYNRLKVMSQIHEVTYCQLTALFQTADLKGISTHQAAVNRCEHNLKYGIGKRKGKAYFHHSDVILDIE